MVEIRKVCLPAIDDQLLHQVSSVNSKAGGKTQSNMGLNLNLGAGTRQYNYQAIILPATRGELLDLDLNEASVPDTCPLAMANVNVIDKPLILFQLEQL